MSTVDRQPCHACDLNDHPRIAERPSLDDAGVDLHRSCHQAAHAMATKLVPLVDALSRPLARAPR